MENNLAVVCMGQFGDFPTVSLVGKDRKGNGNRKFQKSFGNFKVGPEIIDYNGDPGNRWGKDRRGRRQRRRRRRAGFGRP